jgi:CRP/FNR family transcriptional regulator, nitrogen oxide reductase regulator
MKCGCKLAGKRVIGLPASLQPRFLSGLTKTELSAILSAATHRHFLASSVIVHEQDPADRFFVLTSGQGRHFVLTSSGSKILLHWLTPGQIFGGVAVLPTPAHYLASTEVLSDSCALVWNRKTMRQFVSEYPRLLDNALSIAVTEHVAWLVAALVPLNAEDARGRLANVLASLACGVGKAGADGVEIQIGNEDLASRANVTPFTVSRMLRAWQREGILTKGRGKVTLRKPQLLIPR